MSQCAVLIACQRPFRSGCFVPGRRGAWYARSWASMAPESTASATAAAATSRRDLTSSSPLFFRFFGLGLEHARALQQVHHAVVPFVARVLEDGPFVALPGNLRRPRTNPGLGIADGELVAEGVRV